MNRFTTPALPLVLATFLVALAPRQAEAGVERHTADLRDLAMMSDAARATFERGEALFLAGDFAAALPVLQDAAGASPRSAIAFRRLMETQIALGLRDDALGMCMETLRRRGSAMDFRVCVRAITMGTRPLTPDDLERAVLYARKALERGVDLPFGYAAQCDVAHRIGDVDMLNECTKQLQRVAPDHEETRRAMALASAINHPIRMAVAWIALILACAGTLLHAWLRARSRHAARTSAVTVSSLVLCILVGPAQPAHASDAGALVQQEAGLDPVSDPPKPGHFSRFPIDDKNPLESVPPKAQIDANPLQFGYFMMDIAERAQQAADKGDHRVALKYWQTLAKATPDRSYAFAKMCTTYQSLGDWEGAVYSCAAALGRTGATLGDYTRYVGMVLSKKGDLTVAELAALDEVLAHLMTDDTGKGAVDELACRIGVRTWDPKRLASCTASLAAHAPNHPNTAFYQWAFAISRKDVKDARHALAHARDVSVKEEELKYMQRETDKLASRWVNYTGIGVGLLVVLVSGAALAYVMIRRRSPKTPADSAPTGATA